MVEHLLTLTREASPPVEFFKSRSSDEGLPPKVAAAVEVADRFAQVSELSMKGGKGASCLTNSRETIMQTIESINHFAAKSQLKSCHSYILSQFRAGKRSSGDRPLSGPAITISNQTGAGEHEVATRLAKILQASETEKAVSWTVFDRHLVEKVLEEHHLPQSLAKLIPEERRSFLQDALDDLLGVRPPSWRVLPQIAETVLHLAEAGHVILVGRGANYITARLPAVFHVRLIAPLPKRVARIQRLNNFEPAEAAKFVARSDHGRRRYVKAHFHVSVNNNLLYHLVINTDLIPCPAAAELIAVGVRRHFRDNAGTRSAR